jgi:hypothetical protein
MTRSGQRYSKARRDGQKSAKDHNQMLLDNETKQTNEIIGTERLDDYYEWERDQYIYYLELISCTDSDGYTPCLKCGGCDGFAEYGHTMY